MNKNSGEDSFQYRRIQKSSEVKREEGNNGNISQNTVGNSVKGFI